MRKKWSNEKLFHATLRDKIDIIFNGVCFKQLEINWQDCFFFIMMLADKLLYNTETHNEEDQLNLLQLIQVYSDQMV